MRIITALCTALALVGISLQVAVSAASEPRAQLRLVVVDELDAPLPAAKVTVYSVDGQPGREAVADKQGVVVVPSLPAGYAQIHARHPGHAPYIEGTRVKPGENTMKVTLPSRGDDSPQAGS